ncbi:MAG: phosphoglucosamine mutase [Methanomicrobiales archaeon]|nr:phosphoglucosamine mutase [Methanomicrobiales archaeon]
MSEGEAKKRLFGTNGVRGVVGQDMNPELVLGIGAALGSMRKGRIAVGRDTRTSGMALASALAAGLMATGSDVVDLGVLPTPALQYLVRGRFAAGAMVTASHNPPEWNGVKVIDTDGTEMGDREVIQLEDRLFARRFELAPWDQVGRQTSAPGMIEEYLAAVAGYFPAGTGTGITVVVDPGSGAGSASTPEILTRMGCRVHTLNARPDGTFPNRPPEPSAEGLESLAQMVKATRAALGIAHDGDADRTVFIDEKGRFLEENREFALIARSLCRERKGVVVTPVSTSRILEEIAGESGCSVEYTAVGSIYVARRMMDLLIKGTPVVMGGEGNGGLIYPDHQFCRDGAMTAAKMVSLLSISGESLSRMAGSLPVYHMRKEKIRIGNSHALVEGLARRYADEKPDLTDGMRLNRDDSWALVRASGTEPLVRITVESRKKGKAEDLLEEIHEAIRRFTGSRGDPQSA